MLVGGELFCMMYGTIPKTGLNKTRRKDFGGGENGQKNELPEPQVDFLLMGIRELVLISPFSS